MDSICLSPSEARCSSSEDRMEGRAPENGDEVEGSDSAALGGGRVSWSCDECSPPEKGHRASRAVVEAKPAG